MLRQADDVLVEGVEVHPGGQPHQVVAGEVGRVVSRDVRHVGGEDLGHSFRHLFGVPVVGGGKDQQRFHSVFLSSEMDGRQNH